MKQENNVEENNVHAELSTENLNIVTRLRRWMRIDDAHDLLPLALYRFITPSLWIITFAVAALILIGHTTLSAAFMTNIPLNGLIVSIMIIGVGMSVSSNIKLWITAIYLRGMEEISMQFRIRDDELDSLYKGLKKEARIMDCKNFQNLLDNLKNTGALNINDNDARMIKSKLGARIARGRSRVSFLSGLLVMLGLLGTFLGLLSTIDAVGEAMAGMANIGLDGAEDGGGISSFIASLSAPLQGMGLAFSSSLFGLAGSLLVGTYQYFSSASQDTFIESFSRWLDEQIPSASHANRAAARPQGKGSIADDELKAWIVGFIQSSRNAQNELADVMDAVLISADASQGAIDRTEILMQTQEALTKELSQLNKGIARSLVHQARLETVLNSQTVDSLVSSQSEIASGIGILGERLHDFAGIQASVTNGLNNVSKTIRTEVPRHVVHTSEKLSKALDRINNKMGRLTIQEQSNVTELASRIRRLEKMIVLSERRSVQRSRNAQTEIQHQFRRESDLLKEQIGSNIDKSVNKNVIPFIAQEQRQLRKIVRLIDEKYGRRSDDKSEFDEGAA